LGQDWLARERLTALIQSLSADRLVLLVSHDMDFVAEACAKTVVLTRGAIRYAGETSGAFADQAMIEDAGLQLPHSTRLGLALGMKPAPVGEAAFLSAWRARHKSAL
jgi:energy-coupling factor transport system ATP-binding protein